LNIQPFFWINPYLIGLNKPSELKLNVENNLLIAYKWLNDILQKFCLFKLVTVKFTSQKDDPVFFVSYQHMFCCCCSLSSSNSILQLQSLKIKVLSVTGWIYYRVWEFSTFSWCIRLRLLSLDSAAEQNEREMCTDKVTALFQFWIVFHMWKNKS